MWGIGKFMKSRFGLNFGLLDTTLAVSVTVESWVRYLFLTV